MSRKLVKIDAGLQKEIVQCDAIRWEQFFLGDIVFDSFKIPYMDEGILDQKYFKQIFWDLYAFEFIAHNNK